ncbi:MAG: DUF1295 domain-containing protein [Candidatus Omnitrophica bacterium]|nr:DUF1295 domain-containing protein [Candidatus Omnitrophota bacterium]
MINILPALLLIVLLNSIIWFAISIIIKRNDVADISWGLSFMIVTAYCYLTLGGHNARELIVSSLVLIWGTRLALHVLIRNRSKAEDPRYAKWREEWGKFFYFRSFLQVYILQGIIMLIIVSPVYINYLYPGSELSLLDIAGILIWITGFVFEALGDYQLAVFLKDPGNKGKIMNKGLWKYTRHPNYFGEVTMWWGIFIITLSSTKGVFGIFSPLAITYLLLCVSGIPMLEKRYKDNKDFQEYKRKTSPFFPLINGVTHKEAHVNKWGQTRK